jgi:hypothetical protein
VGCLPGIFNSTVGPLYRPPIKYEVSSNKSGYNYGEEITIELLFSASEPDSAKRNDKAYSVKIAESPYYEIVGDSEVYAYPSENKDYKGQKQSFWYRVVFKIKVTEDSDGMQPVKLYINCINDDWLKEEMDTGSHSMYESDHPDYPFGICCSSIFYFGFGTDSKGVQFDDFDNNMPYYEN